MQKLILALAALVLCSAQCIFGQPSQVWENWGTYDASSSNSIDALTFINHPGAVFNFFGSADLDTSDTINYTNQGTMNMTPGMVFLTRPSSDGADKMAANFANLNGGLMNFSGFGVAATLPVRFFFLGLVTGNSDCIVSATNIVNHGAINMNASSLIQLNGNSVDVSRGSLSMTNPTTFGFFAAGTLDGYWGVGTANADYFKVPSVGDADLLFPPDLTAGFTQIYNITNRNWLPGVNQMVLPNPVFYVNDTGIVGSNRTVQAVALANTNLAFVNTVFFDPSEIVVQWRWSSTNLITHVVNTNNYLVLFDDFGEITNLQVAVNGFKNPQAAFPAPTYEPVNYGFLFGTPFNGVAAVPTVPAFDVFGTRTVTNQYAAYEAIVTGASQLPSDAAGGNVTNTTGRIELNSSGTLNLNQAHLSSLNYLKLNCTNHFLGSSRAQIASPWMDINLATTNGTLAVTNLVLPYLDHPEGTIQLYSARWTNVVNGISNIFHVLFVDSEMAPITAERVQSLHLSVTNSHIGDKSITINDVLNVTSDMLFDAQRLTIATNSADAVVNFGQINLLNSDIVWSTATPNLQYLTNWGGISTFNTVYFGGSRSQPPYNTNIVDVPYAAFVNHGTVTNFATLIWATYFENNGIFDSLSGSFQLANCSSAMLNNGTILSGLGDVSLTANSIVLSNLVLEAGGALNLSATTLLDDSSLTHNLDTMTNKNTWTVQNGINLFTLPAKSSLLGTTITNTDLSDNELVSTWAAADLGCSPAGYTNNAAIGRLILEGLGTNCLFTFSPANGNNAIYLDWLELKDFATNRDSSGNFANININPGMKVYFGQAIEAGISIAEKLNGKNGGGFCWVSNYAGFYSGTNFVYPNGVTNRLNTALVTSCDIDSNGNGIVNCQDPAPVFLPASLDLQVVMTNHPALIALVSWNTMPRATNYLYCASASNPTNWTLITNFAASVSGRVTVADPVMSNAVRFYKARVVTP